MVAKKITNQKEPKVQYATAEQLKAAAKLAFITHGQALRELANR